MMFYEFVILKSNFLFCVYYNLIKIWSVNNFDETFEWFLKWNIFDEILVILGFYFLNWKLIIWSC